MQSRVRSSAGQESVIRDKERKELCEGNLPSRKSLLHWLGHNELLICTKLIEVKKYQLIKLSSSFVFYFYSIEIEN